MICVVVESVFDGVVLVCVFVVERGRKEEQEKKKKKKRKITTRQPSLTSEVLVALDIMLDNAGRWSLRLRSIVRVACLSEHGSGERRLYYSQCPSFISPVSQCHAIEGQFYSNRSISTPRAVCKEGNIKQLKLASEQTYEKANKGKVQT